jgi:hypothetical protein
MGRGKLTGGLGINCNDQRSREALAFVISEHLIKLSSLVKLGD